jgi:hypothetical protein
LCGEESKDSKLCKTAVVDLCSEATFLGLLGHALAELERIIEVEGHWVRDAIRARDEVREITRLSSSHVMLVVGGGKLAPEFKEADEAEDLPLGIVRDSIPESGRVGLTREGSSVHLHGPWELDSICVDNVSNKGKHGNTSMLDLSVAQESDGGLVGSTPEFSLGKIERIIKSKNRVQFLRKNLKISLINKKTKITCDEFDNNYYEKMMNPSTLNFL